MEVGVAISSPAAVRETWTTAALVAAAQRQGHTVYVIATRDWAVADSRVFARAFRMEPGPGSPREVAEALTHRTVPRARIALDRLDLLLLRSAPLDPTLVAFGLLAEARGVRVVNRPGGVVLAAHKAWVASLGLHSPRTVVTRSVAEAQLFHDEVGLVVVKPNRGSGGKGVSLVAAGDLVGFDLAFALARRVGDGLIVVQAYVHDAALGEKRLVWCDGQILGGYLRRRAPGEFRHNLKLGATAEPVEISEGDRALCHSLSPHLIGAGIRFAGLDVLGGMLVEVNAVNPGGTVLADALHGTSLADRIIRQLTRLPGPLPGKESTSPWGPPVL